jgi:hypothetical protein
MWLGRHACRGCKDLLEAEGADSRLESRQQVERVAQPGIDRAPRNVQSVITEKSL